MYYVYFDSLIHLAEAPPLFCFQNIYNLYYLSSVYNNNYAEYNNQAVSNNGIWINKIHCNCYSQH